MTVAKQIEGVTNCCCFQDFDIDGLMISKISDASSKCGILSGRLSKLFLSSSSSWVSVLYQYGLLCLRGWMPWGDRLGGNFYCFQERGKCCTIFNFENFAVVNSWGGINFGWRPSWEQDGKLMKSGMWEGMMLLLSWSPKSLGTWYFVL